MTCSVCGYAFAVAGPNGSGGCDVGGLRALVFITFTTCHPASVGVGSEPRSFNSLPELPTNEIDRAFR
jgi:hypothetical protein